MFQPKLHEFKSGYSIHIEPYTMIEVAGSAVVVDEVIYYSSQDNPDPTGLLGESDEIGILNGGKYYPLPPWQDLEDEGLKWMLEMMIYPL